jgi:NAD-dependent dihydropyrimidine dehydrogenase PreA subunit
MGAGMKYLANVVSLRFDADRCTGCGQCVEVCPRGVFELDGQRDGRADARKASITDRDLCMECGACALNCQFGAISVEAGVGCATAIINGIIRGCPPSCGIGDEDDGEGACCA